jgi:hypothetical protein
MQARPRQRRWWWAVWIGLSDRIEDATRSLPGAPLLPAESWDVL